MKRDRETPQSGLGERRGEVKLGGEPTGKSVPCRQCGAPVDLSREVLALAQQMQRRCKAQGYEALQGDELVCCDRSGCREAEADESRRRSLREQNQTQSIIDAIKRGESVSVPSEIVQYRPSCYARIKGALQLRRDGRLPTLEGEVD
jgi:hypothetical protein